MVTLFHRRVQQKYSKLTRSQAALSEYILKNSEEVPFLSSSSLGHKVHVSDATVTRFCHALGYSGYSDFQKDMQRWIHTKLNPSEQLEKTAHKRKDNIYLKIFDRDLQNLKETIEDLSIHRLEEAVHLLCHSRKIFIIGLRSSFALAYLLHYHLARVLNNVILLDAAYGSLYDPLVDIGPKDTLVVISFFQYAKWTLQVAEYCNDRGTRIVSLTDSILSPPAQISDIVIQVKIASPAFFSSFTSAVCAINCLIEGVSLINSKRSVQALQEMESSLPQKDIWLVKRP